MKFMIIDYDFTNMCHYFHYDLKYPNYLIHVIIFLFFFYVVCFFTFLSKKITIQFF